MGGNERLTEAFASPKPRRPRVGATPPSAKSSPGDAITSAPSSSNPELVFVGSSSSVYVLRMVPVVMQVLTPIVARCCLLLRRICDDSLPTLEVWWLLRSQH